MWQANNSFQNNGRYQPNNFNQDDLSGTTPLPSPFSAVGSGPNFFQQPNMLQYDEMNIDGFNSFSPELPTMYNQTAFAHNQFIPPNPPFSPQVNSTNNSVAPPTPTPTKEQLAAKTAELRARLMKGKESRGNSATPPVPVPPKQTSAIESSNSLQPSPKSPAQGTHIDEHLRREKEINDLISDYSETKSIIGSKVNQEAGNNTIKRTPPLNPFISSAKSQDPFSGSPTRVTRPQINTDRASNGTPAERETRSVRNGSMSEGEILDEPTPKKLPPTEPKGNQIKTKSANVNEKSLKPEDDRIARSPYARVKVEEPSSLTRRLAPAQPSRPDAPQYRDDRREENDFRPERKPSADHKHEKKSHQDTDKKQYLRKFSRDKNDDYRRPEATKEEVKSVRESKPPTLAQVLPHDPDLREWLEMTQYHDLTHRNKLLKTARALKELEEQKAKLLAGIQDDQGLVKYNLGNLMNGSMTQSQDAPAITEPTDLSDRVTSNKRNYSEVQDSHVEAIYGKAARLEEQEHDYRRLQNSVDYGSSRRANGDRGSRFHFEESRNRGRSHSNDREVSPGPRAYDSRPPRERSYDAGSGGRRTFEVHGSYRGRAFDPNYRGRGRGRGRGDWASHESRSEAGFGSRNALGKPFKDAKGFDRGGKGDTRYFIVKSFNDENVIKCIEDGVWTTQAQNGPIFKETFETCKNVILVFSINKSRAFQGYARMESLPGSVPVPSWQHSINWESAGAFKVKWLAVCTVRFHKVGYLKNSLNADLAVLIAKDGQEIEGGCGCELLGVIDGVLGGFWVGRGGGGEERKGGGGGEGEVC
ncbi:hypothetical protein sscle_03g029320 [Sclerotinia sclerotiorum 1980 UF-70]|uniref:YTH domain-containing protein n=1 Tax=Sclerotinia sclerotiorum (strain ATCC 18683 / 1980 / Ss-1) TaxID=665079 RepID=A0A1D9Q031_SCLS1|nr:hypothetical protein sscle_03g029320 [Sclerotinia sclerotiorum 1980 UF-70]